MKRGKEHFLQKHGSEEELEAYYVNQLKQKNPELLNPEVAEHKARRQNNYQQEEDEQVDKDSDKEEEEQDKRVYEEPDYSDYYGDW